MATRKTSPSGLTKFEGKDVMNVAVQIRNTGDGLSQAMTVDTVELHHGDEVYVVLKCSTEKLRFDPIKDTPALTRVHMLVAQEATIVDEDLVREHLDAQRVRIEEASGVHRLPLDGETGDDGAEGSDDE